MASVAALAIPGLMRVEQEKIALVLLHFHFRDEADIAGIVNVTAAAEEFCPLFRRLKQLPQIGDRAVMQIGRAQPDCIHRSIGIARLFAAVAETLRVIRSKDAIALIAVIASA